MFAKRRTLLDRCTSHKGRLAWSRRLTLPLAFCFTGSFVVAPAAQAITFRAPVPPGHARKLTKDEMKAIVGALVHRATADVESGDSLPWETSVGGTNTINGNKTTAIPIVGWTARGGMPVQLTLYHNSRSTHNSELGQKWTFSYDIYGIPGVDSFSLANTFDVHWGDDLAYKFIQNMDGSWSAPTGIHDTLVSNTVGGSIVSYDLTTKRQIKYHFTCPNSNGWVCVSITDLNGNSITINHDTGDFVTSVVDPTSRTISLTYTSGKITSISDPLSRSWSISYNGSSELTQITYPTVSGSSYNEQFAYDAGGHHDIVTYTDKRGHNFTATYNSADNSLASTTDACSNATSWSYSSSGSTTPLCQYSVRQFIVSRATIYKGRERQPDRCQSEQRTA